MDLKPYFDTLELCPGASPEEIRQAYIDLVNVWHPDRFAHNPRLKERAEKKSRDINAAYKILTSRLGANRKTGSGVQTGRTPGVQTGHTGHSDSDPGNKHNSLKNPARDKTEVAVELGTRIVLTACYSAYKVLHRAVSELAAKAEREAMLEEQRKKQDS